VKDEDKGKEPRPSRARQGAGYKSARKPKLRAAAEHPEPPPLPALARADGGLEAEDGLRMLAALETIESLEPDFGDDLAAEASVTIIERAVVAAPEEPHSPAVEAPQGSLRARLDEVTDPLDIDADEYAAYVGPVEEAVVEIVEPGYAPASDPETRAPRRRSLPVGHRFLKALTGGD
jgi:hypothetical protein